MLLSLVKAIGYILSPIIIFLYRCLLRRPPPNPDFSGDIVLITGAAQGLGKDLALEFGSHGGVVVMWDINETKLEETRAELASKGYTVFAYVVDCSNRGEIYRMAERVKEEVGNVSVLVNNAGVFYSGTILDLPDHRIETTHNINTLAHYWLIRSFLPWMIQNNYGYIVNITSVAAFNGSPGASAYCSSKAAAFSLCETLRLELHRLNKNGVSVTGVCPWHIGDTGLIGSFQTSLHWLIPCLKSKDVAKKVIRGTYERKFCLLIPSSLWLLVISKFLLPSKAANEIYDILLEDNMKDNITQE